MRANKVYLGEAEDLLMIEFDIEATLLSAKLGTFGRLHYLPAAGPAVLKSDITIDIACIGLEKSTHFNVGGVSRYGWETEADEGTA